MKLGDREVAIRGTGKTKSEPFYNTRRFTHTWVIGKSGVGKSTAIINAAIADILNGEGVAFFDPHGDAIDTILKHIPEEKASKIVIFDPSDRDYPVGFNPLHNIPKHEIPFVASALVDTFKSVWGYGEMATPQLDQYLYNGIAALSEMQDGTLVGLKYLITSETFRKKVMSFVGDPVIKDFWETDFEEIMPEREKRQNTLSTLNKIGALISDPKIRNIIGQPRNTINLRNIMDKRQCLLIRLPQGEMGIKKSSLIGALLMSQLHLTALHRKSKKPFHIYADEMHHFGTNTLEEMLSGIRKFNVSLVLAHQYLDQLTSSLKSALLGTVGTLVSFRIGAQDLKTINTEFMLGENDHTLIRLFPYNAVARTGDEVQDLIMPNIEHTAHNLQEKIVERSRKKYSTKRQIVEARIKKFVKNAK